MRIERLHGLSLNRPKSIKPILKSWIKLMRNLASEWAPEKHGTERDCPWWYLERTSIGFLSAAIWKQGGRAIEEYGTDKKSKSEKSKKGLGRGDLMFSVKAKSRELWFVAEAKQNHPPLRGKYKILNNLVARRLGQARRDATRCRSFGYPRLGLLFLCPRMHTRPPNMREIRDWIGRLRKIARSNNAAMAWSFPSVARTLFDENVRKRRDYYPGVALLVRPPRRRSD
jgi:hypothetical protein